MTPGELQVLQTVALASLLAWASGIRLYLVIFAVGLAGSLGYIDLPAGLQVLEHPWVIAASGWMLVMEFLADKVPGLDSAWDAVHTFIRPVAGAVLLGGADIDGPTIALGLGGGTLAFSAHAAKATQQATLHCNGTERRLNHAVANTSPLDLPEQTLPLPPYVVSAPRPA